MKENLEEKAVNLLKRMIEENLEGVPILVEGITDKKALRELGVKGDIFIIKGCGKPLVEIAEAISNQSKKVIILTDPDHAGARIAARMASVLEKHGVNPDLRYRRICSLLKFSQVAHIRLD